VISFKSLFAKTQHVTLASVPDGLEGLAIGDIARALGPKEGKPALMVVLRDAARLQAMEQALTFYAPDVAVISFPAWDCQPYDRVSPNAGIVARRMTALSHLARPREQKKPVVLLTTVQAATQRVPACKVVSSETFSAVPGNRVDMAELTKWLENNGFSRTSTVRDTGEYAVRGGILDLFAPGTEAPVRLDFFGDTLESIRRFDPETQRTTGQLKRLEWVPMSEVTLIPESVSRFRRGYMAAFGAASRDDALYAAISDGRRYAGLEHWLPLFHETLETIFDYAPEAALLTDPLIAEAVSERWSEIEDHFEARREALSVKQSGIVPYQPIDPITLFVSQAEWNAAVQSRETIAISPFALDGRAPEVLDIGGKRGRGFAEERQSGDVNVFDAAVSHMLDRIAAKKRVVIAAYSDGALDRLVQVLGDHGLKATRRVQSYAEVETLPNGVVGLAVLGLETGFETADLVVLSEQDILGDRLIRQKRKRAKGSEFLTEVAGLNEGDLVVHVDHGIGRFVGLKTITAAGAPHDCLEIHYHGDDKLFLPVENIELLSRYGSDDTEAQLDKLGGGHWQARKAKMKQRIREIAEGLMKTAALRLIKQADVLTLPDGLYDEFCARFPYDETDDQLAAITATLEDMAAGRPMDRLVCGDVGFGKTEVALRAAFVAAASGKQVAVVVPTTLLARQHYRTFSERFKGMPFNIAQLSRLATASDVAAAKAGLASGQIDIVVGTHAVLGKGVEFRDLGLLIIDEEQHFGVKHKERLKEMKANVHVLTLTATPIPRTLQLALTGVRELSIIATPPVDRLAVRTFISPRDPVTIREALLREHYRGGQSFVVVPRISDLARQKEFLETTVPEVKVAVANGQMAAGELEDIMTAFYEGKYDVLLSTTIVESGLDIPTANTLIVHRADMFGLAQLYQLRGRVGRSKIRAYALFTVPADFPITATAERRLKVLQSLDNLGAGFQLASHDLDIRGAGNLLGDEQSGHIREVGYELYQQMLEEAVASLKAGHDEMPRDQWSPSISVGTPVLIPDDYVADLALRLGLYRRLADLETADAISQFGAELIDRFGPLPEEVEHLLKIVYIKSLCRRANVEKIDAGPKGIVISFREQHFANPPGLIKFIQDEGSLAKIRPDQKIVLSRDWPGPDDRLKGAAVVLTKLAQIAESQSAGQMPDAKSVARVMEAQGKDGAGKAGHNGPATTKLRLQPTPPPAAPQQTQRGRYPSLSSLTPAQRRNGPRKWVK
jgi:transcription-repair coupling factor (superfamily II helicase)